MSNERVTQIGPIRAEVHKNPNRSTVSSVLKRETCSATAALCAFVREFGLDATDWDPKVVIKSMEDTFGEIPEQTFNKLFAAFNVLTTDAFYTILSKFVLLSNALSSGTVDNDVARLDAVCIAITEANLIDPVEAPLRDVMSPEILDYISTLIRGSGLARTPDILEFFGIRMDTSSDVLTSWADDPKLYEVIVKSHEAKRHVYDSIVAEHINEIQVQLAQLGFDIDVNEELLRLRTTHKESRKGTLDDLIDALY